MMIDPTAERDTDKDWKAIAEADPFWGVLSVEQYRGKELPDEQRSSFYNSGAVLVENILRDIRLHFDKDFVPTRALDFGCGVGRLLVPIARHTKGEAVGVDVAPNMLAHAQRYAEESNLSNIALVLGDDNLSNVSGDFDFITSHIVFQHIPPSRGYLIAARLILLLRPGGVGSLQLTFAKDRKFFLHESVTAEFYRRDGGTIHDLVSRPRQLPVGTVQMFDYDLNNLVAILASLDIGEIVTRITNDDGHLGVHFLFRRKGPGQP
jgi:SAM-dependent methyltransferase